MNLQKNEFVYNLLIIRLKKGIKKQPPHYEAVDIIYVLFSLLMKKSLRC